MDDRFRGCVDQWLICCAGGGIPWIAAIAAIAAIAGIAGSAEMAEIAEIAALAVFCSVSFIHVVHRRLYLGCLCRPSSYFAQGTSTAGSAYAVRADCSVYVA